MSRRRVKTTKLEIIRCATNLFLENGYTATTSTHVSDTLHISNGNLTYYFPTKEHLLAVLVDMFCNYQWKLMELEANDGISSVLAVCLELAIMTACCETDPVARDFYISAYCSPMCLDLIRKNDAARAKQVFRKYCPDWTEEKFAETEALVSGIEYATLVGVGDPVPVEDRLRRAIDTILYLYNVPEDIRAAKIRRVFELNYKGVSKTVMEGFRQFVSETNEQAMEALYKAKGLTYHK